MKNSVLHIPLEAIARNPKQPRHHFDEDKLNELAQSIKQHGVLQPIAVEWVANVSSVGEPEGDRYIIHYGERRWRAAGLAGLTEIPAILVEPGENDEADYLARAMIENVQRQDLSPIEIAQAYQRLHDLGWSDAKIAESVGKSRAAVANARRLLDLPEPHRLQVANGELSERQALALLPYYSLPQSAQRALKFHWNFGNILKNAAVFSSDRIRDALKSAVNEESRALGVLFPLDVALEGDGVEASVCTDCPQSFDFAKTLRCATRASCFEAKARLWQKQQLAQYQARTGLPAVDLSGAKYNEYRQFYEQNETSQTAVAYALETQCPNLRIAMKRHDFGYLGPCDERGVRFDGRLVYVCHYGEGEKCTCMQAQTTAEDAAREAYAQALEHLKSVVKQNLMHALAGVDTSFVRVALWLHRSFSRPAVLEMEAGALTQSLADDLAGELVRGYQKTLDELTAEASNFFEALGWPFREEAELRLDRIERKVDRIIGGWLAKLSPDDLSGLKPELIAGNVTNLCKLFDALDDLAGEVGGDSPLLPRIRDLSRWVAESVEMLENYR